MSEIFYQGEVKPRPGSYYRLDRVDYPTGDAITGICGCLFKSDWGPLNQVVETTKDQYSESFGTGGTTDIIKYAGLGGAATILACRIGTGGKASELTIENVGKITAKYVGAKAFSLTVREKLTDTTVKEVIIYDGNKVFEKYDITKGSDEVDALEVAMSDSINFTFNKSGTGEIAAVAQKAFTIGEDPTSTVDSYSAGFEAVELHKMSTLVVDTEDQSVFALLQAELKKLSESGRFALGVVAEKTTTALTYEQKLTNAATFNDMFMHYILNPRITVNGAIIDGYQTAAFVGGLISSFKCKDSLTHKILPFATEINENVPLTVLNASPGKGAIALTYSSGKDIWIDAGINTLITPAANLDNGWKSIRRVRTRIELIERSMSSQEVLIGSVDNDSDGRAAIVSAIQGVINEMIAEGSLTSGQAFESAEGVSDGNYAYFGTDVVDKESAEKLYTTFRFQFSTQA